MHRALNAVSRVNADACTDREAMRLLFADVFLENFPALSLFAFFGAYFSGIAPRARWIHIAPTFLENTLAGSALRNRVPATSLLDAFVFLRQNVAGNVILRVALVILPRAKRKFVALVLYGH